jgi:hypothetical protein
VYTEIEDNARTTAVVDRFNAVRVSTLRVELIFVDQGMSLDPTRRPPTEAALDTDDHERNWLGCSHILCRRLGWRCRWVVAHLPLDCTCMAWARQWIWRPYRHGRLRGLRLVRITQCSNRRVVRRLATGVRYDQNELGQPENRIRTKSSELGQVP